MKLLLTADAVGGVGQYATDLARALTAHGVETVIAVMGPEPPSPSPFPLAPEQVRDERAPSLSRREREGGAQRRKGEGDEFGTGGPDRSASSTPGRGPQVIHTPLPLDWLCHSPAPVRAAGEALAALAREVGADIVQVNSPALAAARFDRPVVAVEHGTVATWWAAAEAGPLSPDFAWHRDLTREGLLAADAVVAPTRAHAAAVGRAYALPRAPTAMHNGRTPLPLAPAPPADHAFTAGRLWDRAKRTALLDRVAARTLIRAAGPTVAPHGEAAACAHLELLGTLDSAALGRELAGRPVFVSAAVFEPFGLAVLEAAQAGCPLVLSDIASFRELWDGAALFVAGDDSRNWAEAIGRAKAERDTLGAAARTRAARYIPQATASAMAAIYARLLGRERAAA